MAETEHTKTPWHVDDLGGVRGTDGNSVPLYSGFIEEAWLGEQPAIANAAYIVKAVNSHAAMVEALTAAERELEAIGPMPTYDTYDDRRRLMLGTVKALHHIRAALTLSQGEQP